MAAARRVGGQRRRLRRRRGRRLPRPGDPAQAILGQQATPERLAALREELQLNNPWYTRYLTWLGGLFVGDLGTSAATGGSVNELLASKVSASMVLMVIAAVIAIVPLYSVSLAANYIACQVMFQLQSGKGAGDYLSYFDSFIRSQDVLFSFIKVIIFVLLTTFIQCYYGYFASGGPEGVGVAAGHAIRLAIIVIVFANLIMTLVFWGMSSGVRISG